MPISLESISSFPTLLQLSTKGKGFGSPFPRGLSGAVQCQKLQLLGCGGGWTGLGVTARALPEGPTGSGDNVATRTPGCPEPQGSRGEWLSPLATTGAGVCVCASRASFPWELVPLGVLALG